jgi:hypothetical protein
MLKHDLKEKKDNNKNTKEKEIVCVSLSLWS